MLDTDWPHAHVFLDPISDRFAALVLPPGGRVYPVPGEPKIGVAHPNCDHLADVSVDLDCFYCPVCRWNGRISGAWVDDLLHPADA